MPTPYARFRTLLGWFVLAVALHAAGGCSLATAEVEPDLPTGRVSDGNTLVYRVDGRPVVAHNDSSLGTVLVSIFGDTRPVVGQRYPDSTVVIRARDSQNEAVPGQKRHELHLELASFKGVGTYFLTTPDSFYQESNPRVTGPVQNFHPGATAAAQVVVTEWNATTRQLRGTFAFTAVASGTGPSVALTDGRFDVILDQ